MHFIYYFSYAGVFIQLYMFTLHKYGLAAAAGGHTTRNESDFKEKTKSKRNAQNVLLISFDSFRWDYFDLVDTPVLNSFKRYGVHSKYVKNVIPTSTFPNHVSLATGLYPESHGFVGNEIYDPTFKSVFNMPVTDPKWWWNKRVEPVWYTNEKQGGLSGVCYWPGFNIDGYRPTFYADKEGKYVIPYHSDGNAMPYKERVDSVIEWLQEEKPPNFLMMYFGHLDTAAHRYGFGSSESLNEVSKLDSITGYLLEELSKHKLLEKWNIIITGDHGMTNLSQNRVIKIVDYINSSDARIIGGSGVTCVWPTEGKTQEVYKKLKHAHPNMTVFLKNDIPEKFHFRKNIRVSPIVLMLDDGWTLQKHHHPFDFSSHRGSHGYLNTFPSMWPLFIARGPAFKKGHLSAPFKSVDIYSLMCEILGIQPRPNNGSRSTVMDLLLPDHVAAPSSFWKPILVGVFASTAFFVFGILVFAISMCCSQKNIRKSKKRAWKTKITMSELEQTNSLLNNHDDNDNEESTEINEIEPTM